MQILYFGALKELATQSEFVGHFPINVGTLRQKLNKYEADIDFLSKQVLCAVNQNICSDDVMIYANDEVAFFPPMSGG